LATGNCGGFSRLRRQALVFDRILLDDLDQICVKQTWGGFGGFDIKAKESLYYKVVNLPNKPVGALSSISIQQNRQPGKPAPRGEWDIY
jgi:hypothetical protein